MLLLACWYRNTEAHAHVHMGKEMTTVPYDFQQKALGLGQVYLYCSKLWLG